MLTDRRIGAILRENGHKLTPQRQAVIAAIAGNRDHVTPTEIHTRVRREHPRVGLVTVYRTLDLLSRLGLICEVHAGGTCRSYLLRRPKDDHHHHLICSRCGTVAESFSFKERSKRGFPSFSCAACGFQDNADYNAAKNIAKSTLPSKT